jgi:3-dehydroquinate synthase
MLKIQIKTKENQYPVYLQKGILKAAGSIIRRHHIPRSVLLIADQNVAVHYRECCRQSLVEAGFRPSTVVLNGGEQVKSLQTAFRIYGLALEAGLDREGIVVALGGGVIGDLAGFVAASYMRGVSLIHIPTTLLAMVDSSVGGKVAVNHPRGKNLIGLFHQPSLVLADPDTLKTLPPREFKSGLAELVKYGVILDKALFRRLENLQENAVLGIGGSTLLKFIARAIMIKGKVIYADEKEKGLRSILNFGHTIGHALESATAYEYYRHGEAVAAGMIAATRLSARLKILAEKDAQRIISLLRRLKPPPPPVDLTPEAVLKALHSDKKKRGGEPVFVLPCAIGEAVLCQSPPLTEIREAVTWCLQQKTD